MSKNEKLAATLTIHRMADMTPAGRRRLAQWLRDQVGWIEAYGKELAPRFTARYHYKEAK